MTVALVIDYYWQSKSGTDKTVNKKCEPKKHVEYKDEGKLEQEEQASAQVAA